MTVHFRAYRLRCYPTRAQRSQLAKLFGAARWVWNRALYASSSAYSDPELTTMFGRGLAITHLAFSRLLPQLKKEPGLAWLAACDSSVLTQALRDLVWSRRPSGIPKMVTVGRDCAGRYWVSMAVTDEIHALPASTARLGVDVGIKDLAVLSDGSRIPNPKKLAAKLRHLRRLYRGLSRKKKESGRWRRQRQRIAAMQSRIGDARRDALHQASTSIVRRAGLVAIEDLNVAGMMKNRALARSIADASIAELHRQHIYKAKWYGRELVQVGRFEPSSRLCSTPGCGYRNQQLNLRDRRWRCPACGTEHDRDLNAARNILAGGLRRLAESGVGQGVPELMRVEGNDPCGTRQTRGPASALRSANPSSLLASSRQA